MKHKLLSVKEMQATDQAAIASGIEGATLMENAGRAVVKHIRASYPRGNALVLCGPGNNGGDGFVIARLLEEMNWTCQVVLLGDAEKLKGDARIMYERWLETSHISHPLSLDDVDIDRATLVIDALYGTGLDRPLSDGLVAYFAKLKGIPVVAVDIPSGVNGESGLILGDALKADMTVTFCRKKIGHTLYPAKAKLGKLHVEDIGIDDDHIQSQGPEVLENTGNQCKPIFDAPNEETHKFKRGYAVVAGAEVMTGATRLATRAAQRIGAGYVKIASPEKASTLYRVSLSSAVVQGYRDTTGYKEIINDDRIDAILMGPGMGFAFGAQERILATLKLEKPTVLDADALNLFENNQHLFFEAIKGITILTPHEGEFKRLFPEIYAKNISKLQKTQEAAALSGAYVVLKGPDTVISAPNGDSYINTDAPSCLATAGSGDVLAGLVTGLLAQGIAPLEAAASAVYCHSELGKTCGRGLIAEDLIDAIPSFLKSI